MKIEKYLVLNKYLLSLFGVEEFGEIKENMKDARLGIDENGRTYFVNVLISAFGRKKISDSDLLRYDQNIQNYVRKISKRREFINLRYFQYLAVIFTEIVLDKLKNEKDRFLVELNEFLENYKKKQSIDFVNSFTEENLKKLAFWMATGSGKTLIMHINYYQFMNYKLFSPDSIILITPNEGLSRQHFEELQKSGIPCRLYTGSLNGGLKSEGEVLIIEITKIAKEKKGKGQTVSVDAFEGSNLLFVDEGHKGRRTEEQKWAQLRNELAEKGFTFEYSATFGQILSEANIDTLKEYAKSIIFDYSYKYFYLDGYGKDFTVLNVKKGGFSPQEFQEGMFVANLLSFYEQILLYDENEKLAKEYNLEKPLWIFVGTTVTGQGEKSDVIQIVEFVKRVIDDETWLKNWIEKILTGKSNLKDENGKDVFEEKFKYLRERGVDLDSLYKKIFGGKGSLKLYELKNAEGEIGLKVGEKEYFGVINIGYVSDFKKQLEKKNIKVEQDVLSGSLFDDIKKENSKINILIGSKKFIEGWDTWRVSSMGLLNIGKGQGPQIIQLFGRGVRLKGKEMSLKRSSENSVVKPLEMLNIYGVKADYLDKFLEAIRLEEVEFEKIDVPITFQHKNEWEKLYLPSKPKDKFEDKEILSLYVDENIHFTVDLLPKVSVYVSEERNQEGIKSKKLKPEDKGFRFPEDKIELLQWENIWQEIVHFKTLRSYWNLTFKESTLKEILLFGRYTVLSLPEIFEIKNMRDLKRLEDIALLIIKKYIDLFYGKNARIFETENLSCEKLKTESIFTVFEKPNQEYGYTIQIKKNSDLIKIIKKISNNIAKLLKEDLEEDKETLLRVYLDCSLYVPLLLQNEKIDRIIPAGLVKSEAEFIKGFRAYLESEGKKLNAKVFLLRNYPFSGVGFQLKWSRFFPDFILWLIKKDNEDKQKIVFIDPKGLEYTKGLDDEKIQLSKKLKDLTLKLNGKDIFLDSFIVSKTPYIDLIKGMSNPPSREIYKENNVLFLEDNGWAESLFSEIINF